MNFTLEYTVDFGEYSKKIDFEVSIGREGFDYPGYGGGYHSYDIINDVSFSEKDLTREEIKYINDFVIDSQELEEKIWNFS